MKNARAKRAKVLLSIVKYANLWGFCCRRRRGCLSSLIIRELKQPRRRRRQKPHKFAYLQVKNSSFARAFFILGISQS